MRAMPDGHIATVKAAKDLLPDGVEKDAATKSLAEAEKEAAIAESAIAQALGYELCRCQFPPEIMLKVGYISGGPKMDTDAYECPRCKQINSGGWAYERKMP